MLPPSELAGMLTFCAAMSFSPGPNTTLSTAIAVNRSLARALRFAVAVGFGFALLTVICGAGFGGLVSELPVLGAALKLLGAGYLVWLAYRLFTATEPSDEVGPVDVGFLGGIGLQLVNGKGWLFAAALTAGWVSGFPDLGPRLALAAAVVTVFGFLSNCTWALVGSALRGRLAVGRRLVWFNRGLGTLLLGTAVWMAVR